MNSMSNVKLKLKLKLKLNVIWNLVLALHVMPFFGGLGALEGLPECLRRARERLGLKQAELQGVSG